jgi:hypothetical protein
LFVASVEGPGYCQGLFVCQSPYLSAASRLNQLLTEYEIDIKIRVKIAYGT